MRFSRARLRGHRDGLRRPESVVAEAAGLSPHEYALIEVGALRPSGDQEQALADALGIRRSELQSGTENYWVDYADAVLSHAEPLSEADIEACAQLLARTVVS